VRFLLLLRAAHKDRYRDSLWTGLEANERQVPLDLRPFRRTQGAISAVLDVSASITAFPCGLGGSSKEIV
jgi:hypothetical protein